MSDSFQTVTNRNYFQRLGDSLAGVVFGFILIFVAIGVLSWNEGREVKAFQAIGNAGREVVSVAASPVNSANENKLIHVSANANATAPLTDSEVSVTKGDILALVRTVENYQWLEDKETKTKDKVGGGQETTTTYSYRQGWAHGMQSSSNFGQSAGHENPAETIASTIIYANDAKLGDFSLGEPILSKLETDVPFVPEVATNGWVKTTSGLFKGRGTFDNPQIGDIRISYTTAASNQSISVMGKQMANGIVSWSPANSNYSMLLVSNGNIDAPTMLKNQKEMEGALTWVLRFVGTLCMVFGIGLLLGPIKALGNIIPFVASAIGGVGGLLALALGLPISLVIIAVAWFAVRPILSVVLIGAAIAGFMLLRRKPVAVPAAA